MIKKNFMLYKRAASEDETKRRQALVQAMSALGGGGLGYLLTRYGLGLKSAGAGIVGAGLGAVGGAGLGAMLNQSGAAQKKEFDEYEAAVEEAKQDLDRSLAGHAVGAYTSPLHMLSAGAIGGTTGYQVTKGSTEAARKAYESRLHAIARKVANDPQDAAALAEWKKATKNSGVDTKWLEGVVGKILGKGKKTAQARQGVMDALLKDVKPATQLFHKLNRAGKALGVGAVTTAVAAPLLGAGTGAVKKMTAPAFIEAATNGR